MIKKTFSQPNILNHYINISIICMINQTYLVIQINHNFRT